MSNEPKDAYWCLLEPVRRRLDRLNPREAGDLLLAAARESVDSFETYLRDHGRNGNNNFIRSVPKYRQLPIDPALAVRLRAIVDIIGRRAWDAHAQIIITRKLDAMDAGQHRRVMEVVVEPR